MIEVDVCNKTLCKHNDINSIIEDTRRDMKYYPDSVSSFTVIGNEIYVKFDDRKNAMICGLINEKYLTLLSTNTKVKSWHIDEELNLNIKFVV